MDLLQMEHPEFCPEQERDMDKVAQADRRTKPAIL